MNDQYRYSSAYHHPLTANVESVRVVDSTDDSLRFELRMADGFAVEVCIEPGRQLRIADLPT